VKHDVTSPLASTKNNVAAPVASAEKNRAPCALPPSSSVNSLLRNSVLTVITVVLPALLLRAWIALSIFRGASFLCILASGIIAFGFGYGVMAIFDAMAFLQDHFTLELAAQNALVFFWCVLTASLLLRSFAAREKVHLSGTDLVAAH